MKWKFIVVLLNMGTYTELTTSREACHDAKLPFHGAPSKKLV